TCRRDGCGHSKQSPPAARAKASPPAESPLSRAVAAEAPRAPEALRAPALAPQPARGAAVSAAAPRGRAARVEPPGSKSAGYPAARRPACAAECSSLSGQGLARQAQPQAPRQGPAAQPAPPAERQ